ncbi:MAG TPA: NAD(P)H-hydrate epimerase, partial [Actinobacteria bacterium]|nr:NAD(P)H-hydrate epimerase [Actinomycetota bacterium]
MRPVITPEESARLDAAATLPVDVLMERAGYAVARWAATLGVGYGSRIVVLAGRGNNGGDGYVAARHLRRRGAEVVVRALGAPKRPAARRAAALAEAAGVRIEPLGVPDGEWELLVDAAFGVGFRGGLPPELVPWTELGGPVLAVDVPSGLDAATGEVVDAAFSAELTVTFHALKTGHLLGEGPDRSGRVEVVDIGLDGERPEFLLCEEADAPRPTRPRTAHKWSAGSVLVVGGSPGMVGAPVLVADAALRAGAGAVAIACPEGLQPIYETMRPGLLTVAVAPGDRFGADAGSVLGRASRYDVLVVGPGLGTVAREFVVRLLSGWPGPVVVDADALNA